MTDEHIVSAEPFSPSVSLASNVLRYVGLVYGLVAYVMAIAFWPLFICFIGNLPRTTDTLLERTVSMAPVIRPTWEALAIDVGLIAAFALHHSFLARPGIKKYWWPLVAAPFRRATFSHLANLFAYAIVFHWQPIPIILWQFDFYSPLRYFLLVPFAVGWVMLLVGANSFNLAALFGLRQVWFWFKGKPYEPIDITTGRIYNLARHPEFLGVFAGVWLTSDMTVGHLLLASSFTVYSLIALRMKEGELGKQLGSAYISYRARVPMLGPHWLTATFIGIWLLASGIALAQTSAQRRYDEEARAGLGQLKEALIAYRARHGRYPPDHRVPGCELPPYNAPYDELMAQLIAGGLLTKPVSHPYRGLKGLGYCYKEFEEDGKTTRVVWTPTPTSPLTNAAEPGTCRPVRYGVTCSFAHASRDYCLCLP